MYGSNINDMRETPKAFVTTYVPETVYNTRVNSPGNSKNTKDVTMGNPQGASKYNLLYMMDPQRLSVDGDNFEQMSI